ncbi:hypothetical protein N9226_01040 [bacterium]|nr:hypothetical protein [bacterium]
MPAAIRAVCIQPGVSEVELPCAADGVENGANAFLRRERSFLNGSKENF